jgi:hypothetical protein
MKSQQLSLSLGITALLALICLIDIRTGLGHTPWLLYVIPLGLTYWLAYRYAPLIVALACIVLVLVGYVLSPLLIPTSIALTNRLLGTVTFLALGGLIVAYKILMQRLSDLTEQLRQELFERTQDLGRAVRVLKVEMALKNKPEQRQPEAVEEFSRHLTDVLVGESRRLQERFGHLEGQELVTTEDRLEQTRQELARLAKQLEQFQRDLLSH